ncbi:MAG: hypothetical protein R3F56_21465 [Planctomycetota bacterium]
MQRCTLHRLRNGDALRLALSIWVLAELPQVAAAQSKPFPDEYDGGARLQRPTDYDDRDHTNRLVDGLLQMWRNLERRAQSGTPPTSADWLAIDRARTKVAVYMAFAEIESELARHRRKRAELDQELEAAEKRGRAERARDLRLGIAEWEAQEQVVLSVLTGKPTTQPPSPNTRAPILRLRLEPRSLRRYSRETSTWEAIPRRDLQRFGLPLKPGDSQSPTSLSPFDLTIFAEPMTDLGVIHGEAFQRTDLVKRLDTLQERAPDDDVALAFARELGRIRQLLVEQQAEGAEQLRRERWNWIMAWEPDEQAPSAPEPNSKPKKGKRSKR